VNETPSPPSLTKVSNRSVTAYVWLLAAVVWAVWVIAMGTSTNPPSNWLTKFLGDKVLHAGSFAVGGMLWIHSLRRIGVPRYGLAATLGCLVAFIFGLLLEILQRRIPGRQADLKDLAADLIGIIVAMGLYLLVSRLGNRKRASRDDVARASA
jgi:VanZ family protein